MHASRPGAKPSATLQTDRHAYNALERENCRLVCKLGTNRPVRSVARPHMHTDTYVYAVDLLERGISRLALCRGRRVRSSRSAIWVRGRCVCAARVRIKCSPIYAYVMEERESVPSAYPASLKGYFRTRFPRASTREPREIRRERARLAGLPSACYARRARDEPARLMEITRTCPAVWRNFTRNEGEKK